MADQELLAKVTAQGNLVRELKTAKADKAAVDAAVATLKSLKEDYKKLTGHDVPVAAPGLLPLCRPYILIF